MAEQKGRGGGGVREPHREGGFLLARCGTVARRLRTTLQSNATAVKLMTSEVDLLSTGL